MKQSINPQVFFLVIAVTVVLAGAVIVFVWNRPTAVPEATGANGSGPARSNPMAEHGGPNADQQKQIEEWKKSHPGATTKL